MTWLTPHVVSQVLPADVDYRVMVTFLEFYNTLVQFINFKLYHVLGVRWTPCMHASAPSELSAPKRALQAAPGGASSAAHSSVAGFPGFVGVLTNARTWPCTRPTGMAT